MGHTTQSGQTTFPHQLTTHSTQSTSGPNTVQQPTRTHPMATRAQVGTFKPNSRFDGHTSHISPLPKSPAIALSDANWYKARLVANGRSHQYGVDCDDTFSPVVKTATIRTVLSLALSQNWPIYQLDVKNTFLNGDLSETIYMFSSSRSDSSLFIYQHGSEVAYLLIYVDDIKYAMKLMDRAHMASCNPTRTPVDIESKLGADGDPVSDPTLYRILAGGLQYLTFTRPDISYAVQQVCLYMHDPREPHFLALKRILRYVRGMLNFGLQLYASSTRSLVDYSDAD
ncbi:ribonuclease H-like domain-containing protein [Tanacetum coccineum]